MPQDLRSQIKAVAPRLRKAQADAVVRDAEEQAEAQSRARDARAGALRAQREQQLFAEATRDVKRLAAPVRAARTLPRHAPVPLMHQCDEAATPDAAPSDGVDTGAPLGVDAAPWFARDGIAPNTVRKLRRGDWVIRAQLDLHGMTRAEARATLAPFLQSALKQGLRCVRVVHGKGLGSKNRAPVLKEKVRHWLMQSDSVLAYVEAREVDGGAGAVVVLLRTP